MFEVKIKVELDASDKLEALCKSLVEAISTGQVTNTPAPTPAPTPAVEQPADETQEQVQAPEKKTRRRKKAEEQPAVEEPTDAPADEPEKPAEVEQPAEEEAKEDAEDKPAEEETKQPEEEAKPISLEDVRAKMMEYIEKFSTTEGQEDPTMRRTATKFLRETAGKIMGESEYKPSDLPEDKRCAFVAILNEELAKLK